MTATPDNAAHDPQQIIAELQRKLYEARAELATRNSLYSERIAYQAATNDVLKVMSDSPDDPRPVFDLISIRARDICDAYGVTVYEYDGSLLHWRAATGVSDDPAVREASKAAYPTPPTRHLLPGRAILDRAIVHVRDHDADTELHRISLTVKSSVVVPLMRGHLPIGALHMGSRERGGFSDSQVELLKTFADQAVIAIENARLFNEAQARTRELSESLQQQIATGEILAAINASAGDLQPVFDAILTKAHALCGVNFGSLQLYDGERVWAVAVHGLAEEFAQILRKGFRAAESPWFQPALEGLMHFQILDGANADAPVMRAAAELAGIHTTLFVPMRKESRLLGAIVAGRHEVRSFSEKEIAILESFAAQAAIAIDNARLFSEVQAKTRDLEEALRYQTGSANILNVIASTPTDVEPALQAIVESVCELCEAYDANVLLRYGDDLHFSAHYGPIPTGTAARPIGREWVTGRSVVDRVPVQVSNFEASEANEFPEGQRQSREQGHRCTLAVPLLREGEAIGAIALRRLEPIAFNDKQIALLQTFADQAVIAIENARLFNETTEALERQTATANILKVIAGSPTDVQPVFDAIAESAKRLLASHTAVVTRVIDDVIHLAASTAENEAPAHAAQGLLPYPLSSERIHARVARTGQLAVNMDAPSSDLPQEIKDFARTVGWRSMLVVPMLRNKIAIGTIGITRREPGSFDDKTIDLLKTFADQAVIAIENARLFNETKEALARQTATSDVLKVIASSPSNLQPVFDVIAERSKALIGAHSTTVVRYIDGMIEIAAFTPVNPEADAALCALFPMRPDFDESQFALIFRGEIALIDDAESEIENPALRDAARLRGWRSRLLVPLKDDSGVIGWISITRKEAGKFAEKDVELLQTFADQAVIAIQNVELFEEVQARTRDLSEALQQQTATADVLKVISSSPGELEPVFQALLENAVRLCEAEFGMLFLPEENEFRAVGKWNLPPAYSEFLSKNTIRADPRIPLSRAVITKQPVQVADILVDQSYILRHPGIVAVAEDGGARTLLQVPMLKENELVGTIGIYRQEVRPFSDKQITLVQNFAAQAVIAIENASLLSELRERTNDLTRSLNDLRTAQDRLVQTEKLASLGQLTAGIAHEIKNPLNFVNNFSALSAELVAEMGDVLAKTSLDAATREELEELAQMLKSNLEKVVQHGWRADSIVKNMLQHSREGSGEHRPVDINAIVDESLNLAYHGARAEKSGFSMDFQRDLDPSVGMADVYPQEITRVLLNLISNGFYAATKRKAEAGDGFEPVLSASTKNLGDKVEICIRDNGTGIPDEVIEKIFNPFFTTKPSGEGTGLGLSMSHDIVVKQHGGSIDVETEPGRFTEFKIVLPRTSHR